MDNGHLTRAELQLLAGALCRAMDDRASMADAYSRTPNDPEYKKALALVRKYEKLHVKIFGRPSARQREMEHLATVPLVSITDILATPLSPRNPA